MWLPVVHSWRLNERHYGALQGLNKAETAARYGEQQVLIMAARLCRCSRSADRRRPALGRARPALQAPGAARTSPRPSVCATPSRASFRSGRTRLRRRSQRGRRVIVAAHGNSLRALIKYLDNISDDDIVGLNIPTGATARLRTRCATCDRLRTTTSVTPTRSHAPRRPSPRRAGRDPALEHTAGSSARLAPTGRPDRRRF